MPTPEAKKIAALAGVLLYLQERREPPRDKSTVPSPWALYGRRAIMAGRAERQRRRKQ